MGHEINSGVGNGNSIQLDLLGSSSGVGPAGQSQSSMTIQLAIAGDTNVDKCRVA